MRTRIFIALAAVLGLLAGGAVTAYADAPVNACDSYYTASTINALKAYTDCRDDRIEKQLTRIEAKLGTTPTPAPTASPTPSATPKPSATPTPSVTPRPSPTPTVTSSPTPSSTATTPAGFPDASSTGITGCPTLTKVNNGDEVAVTANGTVIQNVEYLNPVVLNIRSSDVTVRCVKFNGTGYFGIDNTVNGFSSKNLTVDRVDMSCQDKPQIVGMLLQGATATRLNVHDCDHMVNVAGDHVTIADSYCHDLTNAEVVHADCIQDTGGHDGTTIRHNAFYSRDTSDVLLGQEGGDGTNYLVEGNLFSSVGTPPPAYQLYLSGKNTTVRDNVFVLKRSGTTGGFTYGYCTDNTGPYDYTWTGNKDQAGTPITSC